MPYDPELPFLADLEKRVRAYAERAETLTTPSGDAVAPKQRRRTPRRLPLRAARRTAVLVTLLCLLAATAFGTRAAFFTSAQSPIQPHQSRFVALAHGRAGADRWTLRLYARGGQVCSELNVVAQQASSRCVPPPGKTALAASGLTSVARAYVFGTTGARVDTVTVRAGGAPLDIATHPLGKSARALGVPASTRYFVAVLQPRSGRSARRATLTGRDRVHAPLGRPSVVCLGELGQITCAG
jgi:hypothetical protein